MPKYTPIGVSPNIQASRSDLIELRWKEYGIIAAFIIPHDAAHALQVHFDHVEIIRLLDEMPLSTEMEDTPNDGLLPDHFAYSVEGTTFWKNQSEVLKTVISNLKHYRFITGWTCLDVISNVSPEFSTVPRAE